jgi:hypothetical protein
MKLRNILDTLIESQLEIFASRYSNTAHELYYDEKLDKLIHPGEFGGLRESLIRDLLRNFLAEGFGISQGFVIAPNGDVSNQCDVIVYSRAHTHQLSVHQRISDSFPLRQ